MLEKLSVKNFAIIEDITVDFSSGMTVLTGETGAGKSLIIDTISLLLGARADNDMIRYGQNYAIIEGVFVQNNDDLNELLAKYEIPVLDNITIIREISDTSKNSIKINNKGVSLAVLKNVAVYLADIHVQNDTYKLFNPENYLTVLDPKDDNKFDKLLADYSKNLYKYNDAMKSYEHIKSGQKQALDKLEFLKYEREELEALSLYEGIDTELEEKVSKLSNYDKIFQSLNDAYNSLNGDYSALDSIYDAGDSLKNISEYDSLFNDYSEKLMDMYYIATEIKDGISKTINNMDFDEDELNQSIEILNDINKIKEKYKKSVPELIDYLKKITIEIEMVENYDEVLKDAIALCEATYKALCESANKITDYRKKLAKTLEKGIVAECKDLDLDNTVFEIQFEEIAFDSFLNKSVFTETGVDKINFMVSFNKGEPLKPLYKVASGGEMSRMMLAFKSVMAKKQNGSLMVFDEIDTGVSGQTAKKIAIKMHEIASSVQVLCITHLPQVAAIGDNHKHIYKVLNNGRTNTQINDLSYEARVEEIAMMLSGDKLSMYALEHAKSLLNK